MSYDDGRVACTDDALVIRPVLTGMSGRYRLWGSDRPKKSVALIMGISGRHMRPVITPDDPDAVAAELASHVVTVA